MKTHFYAFAALSAFASPSTCFADNGAEKDAGGGSKPDPKAEPKAEVKTDPAKDAATDPKDDGAEKAAAAAAAAADVGEPIPGVAKLRHSGGATTCTHDGHEFAADKKGIFHVPHAAIADLLSHGFEVVG